MQHVVTLVLPGTARLTLQGELWHVSWVFDRFASAICVVISLDEWLNSSKPTCTVITVYQIHGPCMQNLPWLQSLYTSFSVGVEPCHMLSWLYMLKLFWSVWSPFLGHRSRSGRPGNCWTNVWVTDLRVIQEVDIYSIQRTLFSTINLIL